MDLLEIHQKIIPLELRYCHSPPKKSITCFLNESNDRVVLAESN